MQKPGLAIYALTPQGLQLAARTAKAAEENFGPLHIYAHEGLQDREPPSHPPVTWFASLAALLGTSFPLFQAHLFITATGIAVRTIAPHLRSKTVDPAVMVMDQKGKFVISLLSGHLGGANELAETLAEKIGAVPVITTATDAEGLPGIDVLARKAGLVMPDMEGIRRFSAALVAGRPVRVEDPANLLGLEGKIDNSPFPEVTAVVTCQSLPKSISAPGRVLLHPKVLYAGLGCKRGQTSASILSFIEKTFEEHGLSLHSLAGLASFEAKAEEPGLIEAAHRLEVPISFFPADVLSTFPVTGESPKAMETFGLAGVAEPAALAAAASSGKVARLLIQKQKGPGITLAVALADKT